jgi:hypothetical protein
VLWASIAATLLCAPVTASDVRCVVTGAGADNKSTFTFDSRIGLTPAPNDLKLAHLWITDTFPLSLSDSDTKDNSLGVSHRRIRRMARSSALSKSRPPIAPIQQPLWHRTRPVDYVVVLSGEIDLMLDDKVVHLNAGDTVVQQATKPYLG